MKLVAGTKIFALNTETNIVRETQVFSTNIDTILSNLEEIKKDFPHINPEVLTQPLKSVSRIYSFNAVKTLCKQGYTKYLFINHDTEIKDCITNEENFLIFIYRNGEFLGFLEPEDLIYVYH
jgi:hypothetical protein